MRGKAAGAIGVVGALAACSNLGGTIGPNPVTQAPIISRFEVYQNPQTPAQGPFEILAQASGQGTLQFAWTTSGGLLSVASQSVQAATDSLSPALAVWQPPPRPGPYQVNLTVTDATGQTYTRAARFQVESTGTRVVSPQPATIAPPWVLYL
jgi:hypothetical protein